MPSAVASVTTERSVMPSIRSMSSAGTQSVSPRHQAIDVVEPSATNPCGLSSTASSAPAFCAIVRSRVIASRSGPLNRGALRGSRPVWVASTIERRRSGASRRRSSSCGARSCRRISTRGNQSPVRGIAARLAFQNAYGSSCRYRPRGMDVMNRDRCRSSPSTVPSVTSQESAASIDAGITSQSVRASSASSRQR